MDGRDLLLGLALFFAILWLVLLLGRLNEQRAGGQDRLDRTPR